MEARNGNASGHRSVARWAYGKSTLPLTVLGGTRVASHRLRLSPGPREPERKEAERSGRDVSRRPPVLAGSEVAVQAGMILLQGSGVRGVREKRESGGAGVNGNG